METTIYNQEGKKSGSMALPEAIFGAKWNSDLVHQVVASMMSNSRAGTADTKGRGEVRGGGKKPWKQKGTGQARHGSIRSPIWKGGGVTHGPLAEKNYKKKINKKMKTAALYAALSKKFRAGEILFVDSMNFAGKTKDAAKTFENLSAISGFSQLSGGKKPRALLSVAEKNVKLSQSVRNLPQVVYTYSRDINVSELLAYKYLVVVNPESFIKSLSDRSAVKK